MDKKQISIRLTDVELAKVEVLANGGPREAWFRNQIAPSAERRASLNEAAIEGFKIAARAKVEDGEDASEYHQLIAEYTAQIDILRRVE